MPNQSYLDLEDELDEKAPYSSISNRNPLEDLSLQGQTVDPRDDDEVSAPDNVPISSPGALSPNPVRDMIAKRMSSSDYSNDPLMTEYNQKEKEIQDFRNAKLGSDRITNLGQSFAQAAQGASTPQTNDSLYKSLGQQSSEQLKDTEGDLDRRQKVVSAIEQRKSREGVALDNRLGREALMNARVASAADAKTTAQVNKWTSAMKDDLDPNKARGGNMASNQKRVDNAARVEALLQQVHDNPDPRQMEELAISTQALLSSTGSPAAEQVKALIPKSALADANKLKEWLTNNPTGTGQQEFVKRMAETVSREKEVAMNQVQTAQRQRLSAYGKFKEADPDTYNAIINSYGLGEEKKGMSALDEQKVAPVKMQAPDGKVRLVPADQVDAAIAAGGTRL